MVGTANGRTQVQYPCSGGYKLGWVSGTYQANAGVLPQGCVDSVSSPSTGNITVSGWVFDRDSLGSSLQIHVYVGGLVGSGAPGYAITANAYRPDVNKAYPGVGNYHGFHATLSVPKRGNQTVCIYAINVGGGGTNPLLAAKSVNIKGASANVPASSASAQVNLNVPSYKQYDGRWRSAYIGIKTIGNIGCLLTSLSMKYSYHTGTATYPNAMKYKLRFGNGTSTTSFNSSNFTIHDPNSSTRTTLNQFLSTYPVVLRFIY